MKEKILLCNARYVNVFTDTLEQGNVLISEGKILGVGDYTPDQADRTEDLRGKILCPGLIDSHIHVESTMLTPVEFAKACLPCGTTAVISDPHEIANVAGVQGIRYMLEASEGLPLDLFVMLPSCVPATGFDETGAVLEAEDLLPLYDHPRVLGLAEMMNYPGVLAGDPSVHRKLEDARRKNRVINGHAPMLSGQELDAYIAAGIGDDHECSTAKEAFERLRKGQHVMIRQGTAARNLEALLPLFQEPYSRRCLLVTDDRHPDELIRKGHIDHVIRMAVRAGKSPFAAIRMATIQPAEYYGLRNRGAIAPGYRADLICVSSLEDFRVSDVYHAGVKVVEEGRLLPFSEPSVPEELKSSVLSSFRLDPLEPEDFMVTPSSAPCRVIRDLPGVLITDEVPTVLDFSGNNGIDVSRDIIKIAVIERHHRTGHRGIAYLHGIGLKEGAIASSVSHDSHNLIVIGANESDMAVAANAVIRMGGGNVVVKNGAVVAEMPLPIGGLMSLRSAAEVAKENAAVRDAAELLGRNPGIDPFMNLAFISLTVIPSLKLSTHGLVRVETQEIVPLFME